MHPDMHGRPTRFSYLMASDSKHPKRNGGLLLCLHRLLFCVTCFLMPCVIAANVPYRDVLKFDATGQTR